MRYILNGQDITNQPFTLNGIRYPANWWNNTTPEKISALGIEAVSEPEPEPQEFPPEKPVYTPLAFIELFTQDEQLAIVEATLTNPATKLWYDKLLASQEVLLDDERTVQGLGYLVTEGLITAERRDEILGVEESV